MTEIGNSSIFSFALWLNEAPLHNISSLIYLSKNNFVVSGCENGYIIIWSQNKNGDQLTPIHYLIGHKSKISDFVLAGSSVNTNFEYFVSFSIDGEIALWEAKEGRNIEFISNSQMNIQYVFSFQSANIKQRLILCCVKNSEICVLNSMSLAHICTLVCTSSPNWFSSITTFQKSIKDDVILATSVSGLISIWNVNFTDVFTQGNICLVIDADQYIDIETANPSKISHNPYSSSIFLIITSCQFKVFYTETCDILSYQDCYRGDYFIDGHFISCDSIIMHTRSGKGFLYQLPPRANPESSFFRKQSLNLCDNIPNLLVEFPQPENTASFRHKIEIQNQEDVIIIWKGFSNGNIYKWEFTKQSKLITQNRFCLDDSWEKITKAPTSLTKSIQGIDTAGSVTSLLFIHDLSLIVLGMENGWIIVKNICDTLTSAFTENDSTSNYVILKGHRGPVTCLLHPSSTMKLPTLMTSGANVQSQVCLNLLKLTHILWSGGVDYTIRVWDMKGEKMVTVFHCHSSPLTTLKLNHLPLNSGMFCGFSQGFTAAMFNTVNDDEENSHDIKQMINMCMNAFMVGIAENDGISIISIMKQKVLLFTSDHKSPVRSLGWMLDCGYLLIETIEDTVFVWDLVSGVMDRYESGDKAKLLIENCPLITKLRSKTSNLLYSSKSVRRHSLSNIIISDSSSSHGSNNKLLRSQFIHSGSFTRLVPVLIVNISTLLDSLNSCSNISKSICDILDDVESSLSLKNNNKSHKKRKSVSELDLLMDDVKTDKHNFNLKILLIKIILSMTSLSKFNFSFSPIAFNSDRISWSVGQVNSKTGCIGFDLKSLFQDHNPETSLSVENMLIQLSISNKIISFSKSALYDPFLNIYFKNDKNENSNHFSKASRSNSCGYQLTDPHGSSFSTVKSFKIHRKKILNKLLMDLLNSFEGEIDDLSFNVLEKIFNRLIVGILDICDTISKSALQLLARVIDNLKDQQIQNYILIWRSFLSPNMDNYCLEDGRTFLNKIQPFLDKFIEFSYFSSDWIWWFSIDQINTDHERRNLSKIQIKALLNIALVGSHLKPDENNDINSDSKLFSKLFTLDKSFLARITCDFLMSVLSKKPKISKSNIGRLINLSMICLSNGFLVWEPYLDSNTVICKFLYFAIDLEDADIDDKLLSLVSHKAIEDIASARPLIFVMVCYREMLKWCSISLNTFHNLSSMSNSRTIDRRKSTPSLSSLVDNDKNAKPFSLLNRNILVPIFNDLCQHQSDKILDVLPELVELYIYFYIKDEDFSSFMLPVLKFSSVSFNEPCGQMSVGSIKGNLYLFDLKIGKYFSTLAHKKSIRLTKFSDDGRLVASYSASENSVKIWQISNAIFSLGGNSHQVKLINSQSIPSLEQMLTAVKISSKYMTVDHLLDKDCDIYLEWDSDNKTLYIKINAAVLRQIKL